MSIIDYYKNEIERYPVENVIVGARVAKSGVDKINRIIEEAKNKENPTKPKENTTPETLDAQLLQQYMKDDSRDGAGEVPNEVELEAQSFYGGYGLVNDDGFMGRIIDYSGMNEMEKDTKAPQQISETRDDNESR